ncbi:hypothetical protein HP439_04460 [Sphingobacterium shayense]|nr:hypothetical protein [Sphingobacterium shayense]
MGWSHSDLAKQGAVSREMIGEDERVEAVPSIVTTKDSVGIGRDSRLPCRRGQLCSLRSSEHGKDAVC